MLMFMDDFTPIHINALRGDFEGNVGNGRYVLIPGSDARAEKIASAWKDVTVREHSRNHNLYLGKMETSNGDIDMAAISTGMGPASADIVINELIAMGAVNLIRIGTSGSMQPDHVPAGSVVIPTGSVKDETTSGRYLPAEVPAVPSLEFILAAHRAYEQMLSLQAEPLSHKVFFGIVHSKDSLYAREMGAGPKRRENEEYMELLKEGGVLASEMETSILFTLGQIYSQQRRRAGRAPVLTGAVLAVIGGSTPFGDKDTEASATDAAISFALRTIEVINSSRL